MDNPEERNWKELILSHAASHKEAQFFVSPEIPPKIFNNCIKSYAKFVTSQGEKILALYDGGRNGKEGLAFTETGISYRDPYGDFGGFPYEHIISFDIDKSGDPEHPFPLMTIHGRDGTICSVSFMENPMAAAVIEALIKLILEENEKRADTGSGEPGKRSLREQWVHLMVDYLPHIPLEGLYKKPYIPEKQMGVALESYGSEMVKEQGEIFALFEYKTHGSEGFLLTAEGLLYNMGYENWGFLRYGTINAIDYTVQRILNSDVPTLAVSTSDGRLVELQFIIHPSIAGHLFSIIDKGILFNRTQPAGEETAGEPPMTSVIEQNLPHDPANRIYKSPQIPGELLDHFRTTLPEAFSGEGDTIRALYDNSRKESGENGCILTDTAFYLRNSRKKVDILPYRKIQFFEVDSGRHHNDILFFTTDGAVLTLSFHLYKKAQDEFLHFLRAGFPGKERISPAPGSEARSTSSKKYLYITRRTIAGMVPPELPVLLIILSLILLFLPKPPALLFLFSLVWFFSLTLFGMTLASSRNDFFKTRKRVEKCPLVLNKDVPGREKETVILSGKIQAGPYMLEDGTLYHEYMDEEERLSPLKHYISRFKKQILIKSLPFYIDDGTGRLLVVIHDGMVGVFNRKEGFLAPEDTLFACGTIVKNPFNRDFPDADFALLKAQGVENAAVLASDTESNLGTSPHDKFLTFFERSAGWSCVSLGLLGGISCFFLKEAAHQRWFELIVNLFE